MPNTSLGTNLIFNPILSCTVPKYFNLTNFKHKKYFFKFQHCHIPMTFGHKWEIQSCFKTYLALFLCFGYNDTLYIRTKQLSYTKHHLYLYLFYHLLDDQLSACHRVKCILLSHQVKSGKCKETKAVKWYWILYCISYSWHVIKSRCCII